MSPKKSGNSQPESPATPPSAVQQLAEKLAAKSGGLHRPAEADPLLSTQEAADLLDVHVVTVYRLANRGLLPFIRLGHGARGKPKKFRKSSVLKLLREVPADSEKP